MRIAYLSLPAVLLLMAPIALAQSAETSSQRTPAPGAITGVATVDGKPAGGIEVVLSIAEHEGNIAVVPYGPRAASAITDADGHYIVTVAPGRYLIGASGPGVLPDSQKQIATRWNPISRFITVSEGETVKGIDIGLFKTGSISGRVLAPARQPIRFGRVTLTRVEDGGKEEGWTSVPVDPSGSYVFKAVPAGRYKVGFEVSQADQDGKLFLDAYFPGVAGATGAPDADGAATVEVRVGRTVPNVDFALALPVESGQISGVGIDEETGKPVSNVAYEILRLYRNGNGSYGSEVKSDSNGLFQADRLIPAHYVICTGSGDYYSDPVPLDLAEGSVQGLTVKLRRALTVKGTLVVGRSEQAGLPVPPAQVPLKAMSPMWDSGHGVEEAWDRVAVADDGTFTVTGVRPGLLRFYLHSDAVPKGLRVARIEPSERDRPASLMVSAGGQSTNIQVIVSWGSGQLRGRVGTEGWRLPQGLNIMVLAYRPSHDVFTSVALVDNKGDFLIDSLPDGDYTVYLACRGPGQAACSGARQQVTLFGGKAPLTTIVLPKPADNDLQ